MVELLAGDAGSIEFFHGLKRGSKEERKQSRCTYGAITDPAVQTKLQDWNLNGFDIYMTVHLVRQGVRGNPKNGDIEEGRALFIDSDGAPRPDQWHLPPDFIIERKDDPKHNWWAFWIIDGDAPFPVDQIERYQKRIAAQYGTDDSVSDARRIVRLPGYIRHKANEGPGKKNKAEDDTVYRLVEGAGPMTSKLQQHDKLLPEVLPRSERKKGSPPADRERCSEQFMDDALTHTSPDYKRNDGWRGTLGAFIDANVIRKDGSFLPYDEKIDKLRKWSAEGVTYDEAQFEAECEWFLDRCDEEIPERVRLGTVDMLARKGDYTGPGPTKSAQIVERPKLFQAVELSGSQEILPPPDFDRTKTGVPLKNFMNAVVAVRHMAASGGKRPQARCGASGGYAAALRRRDEPAGGQRVGHGRAHPCATANGCRDLVRPDCRRSAAPAGVSLPGRGQPADVADCIYARLLRTECFQSCFQAMDGYVTL